MKRHRFGIMAVLVGSAALLSGCAKLENASAPAASMAPDTRIAEGNIAMGSVKTQAHLQDYDASKPEAGKSSEGATRVTLASMTQNEPERYLIRNATVTVEVKDARQAADQLRGHLAPFKGYVGNAHETVDYTGVRAITMQVRIPYQKFDGAMQFLETLGKALDTQVTAEDVTEEFVDTQSTLRNLKRTEARLLEHLSRTGKLSDTLLVEKELNRVREEIERREGRLRFLANRVAFSTIDVTLKEAAKAQPITPAESFSSASVASNATRSLVGFAQDVWSLLIWLGVWAVVWLPLGLAAVYLLRRLMKSSKPTMTPSYVTVPSSSPNIAPPASSPQSQ